MNRRDFLSLASGTLAGAAANTLSPAVASAQGAKRGGTVTIRAWDPPHFDPFLSISYRIQVVYSFTHSRLLRHKAGPGVTPGTFPLEPDLAESWSQPSETTYVFNLRKGVRWHAKPPVGGRELTAEDVVYSVEHFRAAKGNVNAPMLAPLDRVEALDRYTVRFTLKEPFAWLLEMLANPVTLPIVARECVEKFGDLKKAEAVVGTGPWMLEKYDQMVRRYVQSHTRLSAYAGGRAPAWDGVAITWFDDTGAMRASAATLEYARVRADEPNFLAPGSAPFIITREHVVVA